ncbi:uncharacterized protein N0V89_012373 [Didymosphaeria variabile]|uniref:N-acetyltransferase domain-containing protein n=1 Tax=Didymosphaeria variabile TaxID=1932322 RepID=A0A9W8X926_9PLEO|nr:uncharacterized protein N0V89_012373 [Didymosphaeria variabile]KAJ4344629.1 hypothetical protein N0V89_012373 [Didymosphaeria variabile]
MPLALSRCTTSDVDDIVRLSAAAFSAPTNANVFPNTPTVNAFRTARAQHTIQHDPFSLFLKIVDTELPPEEQFIAYAKWAKPHSKEELRDSGYVDLLMSDELPKECDRALIWKAEEMKGELVESIMGSRPFYHLDVLATHPAHSGRGCAGRLVKWGMQKAQEEGVDCYVEAQDSSKPIFERYGWREAGELKTGDKKWATVLVYTPAKGTEG